MAFLKSVLVGIAALTTATVALAAYILLANYKFILSATAGGTDTLYVLAGWHLWHLLGVSLLILVAGFCWQYRRAR